MNKKLYLISLLAVAFASVFVFKKKTISYIVYHKPLADKVVTLDPSLTRGRVDYVIAKAIYGQLVTVNEFGEVVPDIAKSWTVSKDGKEYVFNLDKERKFHDGVSVTSRDIAYSIHFLAKKGSLIRYILANLKGAEDYASGKANEISGIQIIDQYTIRFLLVEPSFIFLANLTDPKVVILPNNLRGKRSEDFFTAPIGAGSYRFISWDSDKKKLVLRLVEKKTDKQQVDEFVFETVSKTDAIEGFNKGYFQDLEIFQLNENDLLKVRSDSILIDVSAFSTYFMFFNGRSNAVKPLDIRKMIASTVDIDLVNRECRTSFFPAKGIIPKGTLGWVDPTLVPAVNVSYKNSSLKKLRIMTWADEKDYCALRRFINQIEYKLGVKVQMSRYTLEEAIRVFLAGEYDIFIEYLSIRGTEPYHLLAYFDPESSHNLTWFNDPTISVMAKKILATPVRSARASLYKEISNYIVNEKNYAVPLFSDIRRIVFSPYVDTSNMPAPILGSVPFSKVRLK